MIYPVPQTFTLNPAALDIKGVCVEGEYKETVCAILADYGIDTEGGFAIRIKAEKNRKTTYIEQLSRYSDEKYYITADEKEIVIEASCRRGVFRAANTLGRLISKGEMKTGVIEDYPLFEKRGYIEGFYGPTWEPEKRLSVMRLMAKNAMNTFFYAPKDDLYHREKWSELYPEEQLNELRALFEYATENELDFGWCVGPGLTYCYTSDKDFELLIAKFRSIYEIGVRSFGLLLDDIPNDFRYEEDAAVYEDIAAAHIVLVNKTYEALRSIDPCISFTVCPTQYSGDTDGSYITKFGRGVPGEVDIFWTGREICSGFLTCREADDFIGATAHKPLYWDNYPVNDCEMFQHMHLGPVKGRDARLFEHAQGLISNVMEYAESSKIPLMTIADYLWNPLAYDSEKSLENAHRELLGDKAELFKYIADHLCVSCVSRHGSEMMSEILSRISFLRETGEKDKALSELAAYNKKMRECLEMVSDTSVELFAEISKWVKKFEMCCDLLDAIYSMHENPSEQKRQLLIQLLDAYNSDAVILTGFCLRELAEKTIRI